MQYDGNDGHATYVVSAYNPCKNYKKDSNTVYQQHRRYFIKQKMDTTCPKKLFRLHLVHQLKLWRKAGARIVLFIDHNEHIYDGPLGRELADKDGLGLVEAVSACTGEQVGATFYRGTRPIDGLWVSSDLTVANACVMPFGYGVGDHRLFV